MHENIIACLLAKSNTNFWVVETKSYGLYKNFQFECCQRLPLLRFVPCCFLFRGMVRNGIPRVCFYFCSTERNSELFPLPLKGLEGNSEILLLFQFHGTEFRVVFSSAEGFGREFREFASNFGLRDGIPSCFLVRGRVRNGIPRILFRGTVGILSEITICSVNSVFRGIIFLSEIPNPRCTF